MRLKTPMNTPAKQIVRALGGQWHGTSGAARCPAHRDRVPSLSVTDADGRPLVYCHAGCSQEEVITALRTRGLWGWGRVRSALGPGPEQQHDAQTETDQQRKKEMALGIWADTQPAPGTPVEKYLRARGVTLPVPDSLGFHPGLKHPSGGIYPAMVGLVARGSNGEPIGVHRTFLSCNGGKAPVTPQKMMLGPCRGGVVRLGPSANPLMVGEGIETALSAMQATGWSTWAALSTSGLCALELPPDVQELVILADGDDAGESAAKSAALRWKREGRLVRIARPPIGMDFNDVLNCGGGT
jgi:putative DNA primase/helicase